VGRQNSIPLSRQALTGVVIGLLGWSSTAAAQDEPDAPPADPAVEATQPPPEPPEAPAVAAESEPEPEPDDEEDAGRPVPPPPPPSDEVAGTQFLPRFVLETARAPIAPPDPEFLKFQIHGEYQLRASLLTDLPLRPFRGNPETARLGQTFRLEHWHRITPRLYFSEEIQLVGQIDLPRGFIAGQETRHVEAAERDLKERQPLEVDPRWLYLDWLTPVGLLRVGQQPSHWGMGIIANDGDHPSLFGDYRGGAIVERILFATKPAGKDSPFTVAIAGDLVFRDANADLRDDQVAFQGVLAAFYADRQENMIGVYGVYRHQRQEDAALPGRDFDETLRAWAFDSSGRFNAKIPGTRGFVFGEYEVAYLLGDTDIVRTTAQTAANEREKIRAFGAATRLGAVVTEGEGAQRWGKFVAQVEWGWASGDADPNDGVTRRFRFDPNHNVGLILFDEVLHWKTARAATIARDPELTQRPNPGVDLLPSNGSIFGATYLYPTVVFRPMRQLDLKAGAVIAQTTADFVDPVQVGTSGRFVNYDGGSPKSHDLGIELDAGVEYRLGLDYDISLAFGAEGGVFFPGNGFADAQGNRMNTQYIGVLELGLYY
jgi:hypothetical protein